jgi:predicted GIY-YIG superfamily endonuclease
MNAGADLMNPQSWNGYGYVQNNPLNATDPTGMNANWDICGSASCGVGGGWGDGWGSYYIDGAPTTASAYGHMADMSAAVACPGNVCSGFAPNSHGSADHFEFVAGADGSQGYSVTHITEVSSTIFGQSTSETRIFREFLAMSKDAPVLEAGVPSLRSAFPYVYSVYIGVAANGSRYIGITNDFARRAVEHLRNGIAIQEIEELRNLNYLTAKGAEQALINHYQLGNLINKINSISTQNPLYKQAVETGESLLKRLGILP